jgi:glycosyltransferase involved in cell wall biosynthesis
LTSPIELLQVVTTNTRRGAETFAVALGAELAARGHSVTTVALARGAGSPLDVPVLGPRPLALPTLRALRRRAARADVVLAHGSRTLPACALALAGAGTPFVYRNIGDPTAWSGSGARRLRTRWFLRRAALVVALTESAASTFARDYGVAESRLTVIPSGAPVAANRIASAEQRAAARADLALPDDALVVAFLGALSEEKRPELALEAIDQLGDAVLLVAGDGPLRTELATRGLELAPGRVYVLGALADPTPAYDAADVVVLPSRTEGMPGVLIEAGLRGLPSVATDVGYVRDVVRDGVTGVIVPSGDAEALARGIEQAAAARAPMGAAAHEHCVRNFGFDAIVPRWDTALTSLVG